MLRTLPQTRQDVLIQRAAGIVLFTLLTIVAARLRVYAFPVPFTMQTFAVLLAGLVLGARDGFLSQAAYLGLIAMNIPVDTNMLGAMAFVGPTAGFLVSFPVVAFVAGALAEQGADRFVVRWLAGVVGVAVLFVLGTGWFAVYGGGDLGTAWALVWQPFVGIDLGKAALAAALAESGRAVIVRRSIK